MKKISGYLWVLMMVLGACNSSTDPLQKKLIITATYPIADIAKNIAGDSYMVHSLVAPGQSPHTFSIGTKEAALIEKAAFWIKTGIKGIETENQIQKFAHNNKKLKTIYIHTKIQLLEMKNGHHHHGEHKKHNEKHHDHEKLEEHGHAKKHEDEHHHNGEHKEDEHLKKHKDEKHHDYEEKKEHHEQLKNKKAWNPHIWLSVKNAIQIAENIKNSLSSLHPKEHKIFQKNFETYRAKLLQLEKEISEKLKSFRGTRFVQFHPAWDYFAADYGFVSAGVVEMHLGHEQTSGLHEMKELIENIKKHRAKVIFAEAQFKSAKLLQIAKDLNLKVVLLDPLGGKKGRKSYIQLMRWNLNALLKGMRIQ